MKYFLLLLIIAVGFVPLASAQASLFSSGSDAPVKADTAYELIEKRKDLNSFKELIDEAGLKDVFQNQDQTITVFAPNNDAIDAISRATMKSIKASKGNLTSFVKFHVITGSRISSSAINERKFSAAAANGESLTIDGTVKKEPKVNGSRITTLDLQAGNNIVHVIDTALIPASLNDTAPSDAASRKPVQPVAPNAPPTVVGSSAPAAPKGSLSSLGTSTPAGSSKPGAYLPVGSTAPVGSSAPIGSASPQVLVPETEFAPLGTATTMPGAKITTPPPQVGTTVPPPQPPSDTPSKGFNFFGHHFGG